jgi:hypothetical protein
MPAYSANPLQAVSALVVGDIGYSFGSLNRHAPPCRMAISALAIATNVVTANVAILEGFIPSVGDLVTVVGTSIAGVNVSGVAITTVTINASTGIGTIVFPATAADQPKTGDTGRAIAPVSEVGEVVTATEKGQQFSIPIGAPPPASGVSVGWSYAFPVGFAPGSVSISLQGALEDIDSQYSIIDTGTLTTNETRFASLQSLKVNFLRLVLTSASGGSASYKCIGKILA